MWNGSFLYKSKNRKTIFSNKKEANKCALENAKGSSKIYEIPYKGGVFGNSGLAFYSIGTTSIEIVPCEQIGEDHDVIKNKSPKIKKCQVKSKRKTKK